MFQNRRPSPSAYASLIVPFACSRGTPVGLDTTTTDGTTALLAAVTNFLGFVGRNVTADGPTLADHVYPGRLDLPDVAGGQASIEGSDEFDCSDEFINLSGTGSISTGTAVGSKLSFRGGKLQVAQSTDVVYYTLAAQLTPDTALSETVRVRAIKV